MCQCFQSQAFSRKRSRVAESTGYIAIATIWQGNSRVCWKGPHLLKKKTGPKMWMIWAVISFPILRPLHFYLQVLSNNFFDSPQLPTLFQGTRWFHSHRAAEGSPCHQRWTRINRLLWRPARHQSANWIFLQLPTWSENVRFETPNVPCNLYGTHNLHVYHSTPR